MAQLELGLDSFGDVTVGPDGKPLSHAQVLRNVVAEAELADRLGLHFFGVGEHYREDFAVSAPDVVRWGGVRGRSVYELEFCLGDPTVEANWKLLALTSKNWYNADGLESDSEYYFRVKAIGAAGAGPLSDSAHAKAA